MTAPTRPAWLDADRADFMQGGVSLSLGACGADLRPSVTKGIGCRVLPDGEVRVFVEGPQSRALLADVQATGRVAVVFSEIVRHRTLQVKAADARVVTPDADDHRAIEAHGRAFGAAILALGYPESLVRGFLVARTEDRVTIVCRPHEAFEQTPGPQAGQRLEPVR